MRRVLVLSAVALFLLGMTVNVALAADTSSKAAVSGFINGQNSPDAAVDVVRSFCFWGFYINNQSQGWETRLFVSNLDTQAGHSYDVFVLETGGVQIRSFNLAPSGIQGFTCQDLNSCGQAGWLYVQSNANIFGATLFVINNIFGG